MSSLLSLLTDVLSERPTRESTGCFINFCRRQALAYLRRKARGGRLNTDLLGARLDDLALDCIAGLFERATQGHFVVLQKYFEANDWQVCTPENLETLVRRLVFGAVNDHLFSCYRMADASLANLLRSLKRAVAQVEGVVCERHSGVLWFCAWPGADREAGRSPWPPELLEAHLTGLVHDSMTTRETVEAIAHIIRGHTALERRIPMTALAQVVRRVHVRLNEALAEEPLRNVGYDADVSHLISRSVAAVAQRMRPGYRLKVAEGTYHLYFEAIRDRLTGQFVLDDGRSDTNFKALKKYLPGMSLETYRAEHRAVFEYLSKSARDTFIGRIKEDFARR